MYGSKKGVLSPSCQGLTLMGGNHLSGLVLIAGLAQSEGTHQDTEAAPHQLHPGLD